VLKPRVPETTLVDSLQKADKAVVYIITHDALGNRTASGSGFVISKEGLVATNSRVQIFAFAAVDEQWNSVAIARKLLSKHLSTVV